MGDDDNSGHKPDVDRFFEPGTFNDWLDATVIDYGDGYAELRLPMSPQMYNEGGSLHGGVTAAIVDLAGGIAIDTAIEGESPILATTSLDVTYLRPITRTAYARGDVVRIGRTDAVARISVRSEIDDGDRQQVAIGTARYRRP